MSLLVGMRKPENVADTVRCLELSLRAAVEPFYLPPAVHRKEA